MADNLPAPAPEPTGEIILYQTEDGISRIEVRLEGDTVWLSQRAMADLFQTSVPNVNQHLKTIYEDGELRPEATIKRYLIVQTEGSRQVSRAVDHYNLDVIISVGYRVRSHRGTQFRIWATERLREYLIKGFTMDDARLKRAGGGNYFEELLARIRDIRSSERVFWRKVLDKAQVKAQVGPKSGLSRWTPSGHQVGTKSVVQPGAPLSLPVPVTGRIDHVTAQVTA